ncbi:MAG: TonB-dependent receptor plug domain-containing protein [Bacteroidales bacterium]|jgi:outer membrane cobalamin receptor|nr:TonB-dependent receptor plug domain-containing protein [Bacteroidales bacterium]MCI2121817.1 TonB-dependent receptor plug domain-containing protein [Bacteroidales bacterium]MCI2146048.1 TonB-dependent receptor plug domain-containing protein [Bacteroidales bacterium]
MKRSLSHTILFAAAAFALALQWIPVQAGEIRAAEDSGSFTSPQRIDSSVICASRLPDKIIPAQVLSGKQLQNLSVHSVADAIRYFSGVQIKDYGGIGGLKTVNVRSLGSEHVGVFYDGIQLGNAQNGQVDLGRFSLDNMSSVTLYNGQKSTGLQSAKDYASASSFYMQTRIPDFADGKKYNVKITMKGGSFDMANPSLLYEQKVNDKISNSFNAEYLYTSGKYKFSYTKADGYDTTAVRQNGDVKALRVEEGLFGTLKNANWKAKAYFYDSERGYPGAFVREEPGKFKHEDRQWDRNIFLQGSITDNVSKRYRTSAKIKLSYDYLHYISDPRLDVTTMYVDNTYRQKEAYLSTAHEINLFKWWDVNVAADVRYNALDADLVNFVEPSRFTGLAALASSFRFGKFRFQGSVLYTFVNDTAEKEGAAAGKKSEFTPTLVFSYAPFGDKGFSFRSFYKRIFRMPTLNDLYYTFIGNKYLNPEYTTQYDLGFTYSKGYGGDIFKHLDVAVDGYFNKVKDKIIAMPASNQFQWTMVNLGYVEIRGTDVAASCRLQFGGLGATLHLNYTFQKAQDFTDKSSSYYGGQIPYVPWDSGSAVLSAEYGYWSLNYSFIYTGERYDSSANIPENYELPWYTNDISVSRTVNIGRSELYATLEVNNLLDQQYEVVQCYPMPGRNFKFILSLQF